MTGQPSAGKWETKSYLGLKVKYTQIIVDPTCIAFSFGSVLRC